ncbi:hypothetical protein CBS147346_2458 [Aspergillus niger]|nr:hypothetical protein CBS147346_2458 [Aspergillus niger]
MASTTTVAATTTTTTTASTTSSVDTATITTLAMSTVYTPPASCSSSWTYEAEAANDVPNGLLMQNCVSADTGCFPSGFSHNGRVIGTDMVYSPGWCPMGYTSADMVISQAVTTAVCCISGFSYFTELEYQALGTLTYAGCISTLPSSSSTIVTVRQTDISTQVTGPITMWAQPIRIEVQATDVSLFVTTTSTSSSTASTTVAEPASTNSIVSPTSTATESSSAENASNGLSTGAEVGIGVGVGVGALCLLIGIAFLILRHYKLKRKARIANAQYPYYYGGELVTPKKARQSGPSELPTTAENGNHTNIHELYA